MIRQAKVRRLGAIGVVAAVALVPAAAGDRPDPSATLAPVLAMVGAGPQPAPISDRLQPVQVRAVLTLVRDRGYACERIRALRPELANDGITLRGYELVCDGGRQRYDIVDLGRRYAVHPARPQPVSARHAG